MGQTNNIPKGYKDSPLGIIPEEWDVSRLGEICVHFKSGITITSKNITEIGDYPVYGGNGLRGYADTYTHDGDYVLIGRQGALCGNINYIEGKNYVSEHAIAVQALGNLKWLKYKLDFWNLNRFSESSAQPGLSVEKLVRYKLSVPPVCEQQKIAEILSVWDEAIEKQTQLIIELETRKHGLMQQLLTGKNRLKRFGEEKQFRNLKHSIKEVSERNRGNVISRVLSVTNSKGFIQQEEQFDRVVASQDICNYKIVREGQFAYNPSRVNVGSLDLLINFTEGILSPMYVVFKADSTKINTNYLFQLLKSSWFTGHIPMYVQGSVRDSLSFDGLCAIKFFIPSLEEQVVIADILSAADEEINLAKQKLAKLNGQKKGLMQVLLTGKKRVTI